MYKWNFGTHDTILVILYKINKHVGGSTLRTSKFISTLVIMSNFGGAPLAPAGTPRPSIDEIVTNFLEIRDSGKGNPHKREMSSDLPLPIYYPRTDVLG